MNRFYIIAVWMSMLFFVVSAQVPSGRDASAYSLCVPGKSALHFWDDICFADTAECSRMKLEHRFEQFLTLLSDEPIEVVDSAFTLLLRSAMIDASSMGAVYELAEFYLNGWDSPMRNEDFFISFLKAVLAEPALSDSYADRSRYLLAVAQKNRPGSIAADFVFEQADGTTNSLHQWVKQTTLLVLYSADCGHCAEVLTKLKQHDELAAAVEQGAMNVLAVCIDDNRELWRSQTGTLPKQWGVGYDGGSIMDADSYELSDLPAIYVLDSDCRVRIKELCNLDELGAIIGH